MENLSEKLLYYRRDINYLKRKISSRINEIKIKWEGYNKIGLPFIQRYGLFIPIFFALFANSKIYKIFKYFDPRNNKKCIK